MSQFTYSQKYNFIDVKKTLDSQDNLSKLGTANLNNDLNLSTLNLNCFITTMLINNTFLHIELFHPDVLNVSIVILGVQGVIS